MIRFPNCKINLGLRIVRKRADGFHDLETVFYPLPLYDALELVPAGSLQLTVTGMPVDADQADNICVKAWHLLNQDFPELPPVSIHLHKAIPLGAGLGGGSADGAFMLSMLNDKFQLAIPHDQLIRYALALGSDCPFFVINRACYATGRGENLEPISLDLSDHYWILVNPGIHISTAWAFGQIRPGIPKRSVRDVITQDPTSWKEHLINDFETPVFETYPEVHTIRDELYRQGAVYAAMSGSGSTVFGLFRKGHSFHPSFPNHYFVRVLTSQV